MSLVLPQSTVRLVNAVGDNQRHPGLQLDKFSVPGDQRAQKAALTKVCNIPGNSSLLKELTERRNHLLISRVGTISLRCTTIGPLTLHLARASALENAGICLHPLYGFAYLPGSGLKGMARAYAETIWLPAQPDQDQKQAWRQIEDVFGWASNPDRRQQNDSDHPAEVRRKDEDDPESLEIKASSGNIVFHDAWPESWPKLIVDIVNNHHPDYYQHDDNNHPPGDWENPVPVYFLAVKPGVTFTFPLAKRRADVADELLDLARQWLLGALCHLGAGAKTNAGYGAFKPAEGDAPALPTQKRATFETTLELVTPAFLAGANQQAEDCDLRPATLRGLLRWWWRTMHAGFVDVKTLRALEAAIWGDTKGGGAVRIELSRITSGSGTLYSHPRERHSGIRYIAHGMDEISRGERRQRFRLDPPASWSLRLIARRTEFFINRNEMGDPQRANKGQRLTANQVLDQAKAALWLLCHFGGVGSKARKGFGSLAADQPQDHTLETCKDAANQLRHQLGLASGFDDSRAHSPALQQILTPVKVSFSWPDIWTVLDQVGFAYEAAAHQRAHSPRKVALGLPRQIHGPRNQPLPHQNAATHQRPQRLRGPMGNRHSSPVHIHVEGKPGNWTVRAIALPAAHLPDLNTSRTFLEEFLKDFGNDLGRRASLRPPSGPSGGASSPRPPAAQTGSAVGPTPVRVRFLGLHESLKTPQQAFWVQEVGKKRGLLKYGPIPTPLPVVDSEIEVYRTNENPNSPEYRWDRPAAQGSSRGGSGGQQRGRRR
jgi:CRISPR-associated protein Cmr6